MNDLGTQKLTIEIDGNISNFESRLKELKSTMDSLDLTKKTQGDIERLISSIQQNLDNLKSKTEGNQISFIDQKAAQKAMDQITEDFRSLANKINSTDVASRKLKEDVKLTQDLTAQVKSYTEASKNAAAEQKRLNSNLTQATKEADKFKKATGAGTEQEIADQKQLIDNLEKQLKAQRELVEEKRRAAQHMLRYGEDKERWKNYQDVGPSSNMNAPFYQTGAGLDFKEALAEYNRLQTEMQKAIELQQKLDNADYKKLTANVQNATDAVTEFEKKQEELKKQQAELVQQFAQMHGIDFQKLNIDPSTIQTFQDLKAALTNSNYEGEHAKETMTALDGVIQQITPDVDNMNQNLQRTGATFDQLSMRARDFERMKMRLMQLFSIGGAVRIFRRAIRSAFNAVKELDEAMTAMSVVTDLRVGDYWEQLPKYTKQANELGVATKSVYEAATLYYQQGLKTAQVEQITTATLKMARIASLDAAEATDRMTNALRGFNMEINQTNADRIADVYSKLAAITASNVDEISTAMTKTASIASNAGMEFETTAAFLSQIIETTRESAETAGTALKTVIARFQELKKDPSEIGEIDGEIVDANKVEKALRSVGIALRDSEGQFRKLDDVFLELASKWNTLDKNTQRYIATIAAGSRQQSRFIAMMSDYEHTLELVDAATNAAGASQEQYEKTLDSLETKLNRLKNAWNEFTMGITNSGLIKGAVDLLTGLLNVVNKLTEGWDSTSKSFLKLVAAFGLFRGGRLLVDGILAATIGVTKFEGVLKPLQYGIVNLTSNFLKFGKAAKVDADALKTATEASKLFSLSASQIALIIAAIAAALFVAYKLYQKFSLAGQAKEAQKAAEEASQKATELNNKYSELTATIDDLSERYNAFDSLIEGTEEWNRALFETNQQVLKLLEAYPELISLLSVENGIYKLDFSSAEFQKFQQQQQKEVIESQQISFIKAANSVSSTLKSNQNKIAQGLNTSVMASGHTTNTLLGYDMGQTTTNADIFRESYAAAGNDPEAFMREVQRHYHVFDNEYDFAQDERDQIQEEFAKAYQEYTEEEGTANLKTQEQLNLVASSLIENSANTINLDDTMKGALKQVADGKWFAGLLESAEDEQAALTEANAQLGEKLKNLQALFDAKGTFIDAFEAVLKGEATAEVLEQLKSNEIKDTNSWEEVKNILGDDVATVIQLFGDTKQGFDQFKNFYMTRVGSIEQANKQSSNTFSRLRTADFGGETVEVRQGIATLLDNINTQVGTSASQVISSSLAHVLASLNVDDRSNFLSYLNQNSWMKNTTLDEFLTDFSELGIEIDDNDYFLQGFIKRLINFKDELDTTSLEEYTKQLQNQQDIYFTLNEKLQSGKGSTFTQKEIDELVSAGYTGEFVQIGHDQYALTQDLYTAVKEIEAKIPGTIDNLHKSKEEAVATGEAIGQLLTEDETFAAALTGDYTVMDALYAPWAKALGLYSENTDLRTIDATEAKQKVEEAYALYYGANGGMLEQNRKDLTQGNPNDYATLQYGQDFVGINNEAATKALDARMNSVQGLDTTYKQLQKDFKGVNDAIAENDKLLKMHVYDTNIAADKTEAFGKAVGDALGDLQDNQEDLLALGNLTDILNQYYNTDKLDIDFTKKVLPLLTKLGDDDKAVVAKTWEELGRIAGDAIIQGIAEENKGAGTDAANELKNEVLAVFSNFPKLEFALDGTADCSQIFDALVRVGFTAKQAAAAIEAINNATVTFDASYSFGGKQYGSYEAARAAAVNWNSTLTRIRNNGKSYTMDELNAMIQMNGGAVATVNKIPDITIPGGNKGKGGSKSDKEWKNPYDWLYNKTEELNELLRERERIERRYQSLERKRDANTLSALKLRKDETANLQKQLEIQKELEAKRYEELHKLENEAKKTGLYDYAEYDERGRVIKIDWDRIDKVKDTERGEKIEEYIKHLETLEGQFDDIEDAINSIDDDLWEMHQQAVQDYLELEHRLATALEQIEQNDLDEQREIADAINQARENLVSSIESNINQLRQDRANEKQEKDIAKIERRLAYLQQDTSNATQLEQLNLQEQLSDLQETYGDSLIDQSLNEMKQQNEAAAAQRDRELELWQDEIKWNHDHGVYAEQAYDIIMEAAQEGFVTENSALYQTLFEGQNWMQLSAQERAVQLGELYDLVAKATTALLNGDVLNENTNYNDKWLAARDKYLNAKTDEERAQAYQEMVYWERMRDEKIGVLNANNNNKGNYQTTEGKKSEGVKSAQNATIDNTVDYMKQWQNYAEQWASGTTTATIKQAMYETEAMRDKKIRDNKLSRKPTNGNLTDNFLRTGIVPSLEELRKYATGGMVTKTGLAWLDGTYSAPEAVLSAKDTQNFIQLRDSLRNLEGGTSIGDSYIDIDINVDQIADDYDVDQMADRIKQIIYNDATYRNVNNVNFIR